MAVKGRDAESLDFRNRSSGSRSDSGWTQRLAHQTLPSARNVMDADVTFESVVRQASHQAVGQQSVNTVQG
jgi:hypothetical protein